jgi:photosystem II stability/assembly factor-like uncharacterized protein
MRPWACWTCSAAVAALAGAQTWTPLGPAPISNAGDSGRVSALACHPTNPGVYYVGAADGGVWRTADAGATWTPLTDRMPCSAIGALALDPADPQTIYVGTGEANFANHSRYGLGLYKSTDGGQTWSHLAESTFGGRCFSRIIVDPTQTSRLYASITTAGGFPALAAAKGHPDAAGPLGVFRSDDAGQTWSLLPGLPAWSITDLAMDPGDPAVLYAAVGHIFGDPANGVYKSTDGGATWARLGGGLPTALVGRIALAVAPSNPQRLYALMAERALPDGGEASTQGAYRSDDAGLTWTRLTALTSIHATYGWYLNVAAVHPSDPDVVVFGGLTLVRSTSAGSSFTTITPPHVDMHAVAWDAAGRLLVGDDGGLHRSTNAGGSWQPLNAGLGIVQFYPGLSSHPTDPTRVLGGTQDNGSNLRSTDSLTWTRITGGDGGWTQWDQASPNRLFTEMQGTANVYLSTNGGGSFSGTSSGIVRSDRNCFLPPYLIDAANSARMFYATHRVYRSINAGASWTPISLDLTQGEGAIRALALSPADPLTLYAATNDSRVLASSDGGFTWDLRLDDHHGWPRVTRELWADPVEPGTAYLAGARFGMPHVRRTRDRGESWEVLDGDLPDVPVNAIATDPRCNPPAIYAGTDASVYRSVDGGRRWREFGEGLPRCSVIDLKPEPGRGRLIVGTMGRGAWVVPLTLPDACPPACDPDYTGDGSVDQDDVAYLIAVLAGGPNPTGRDPDFGGDGNADQDDVTALVHVIAGGACP